MNKLRAAIVLILSSTLGNREIGRQLDIAYNVVRRYRKVVAEDESICVDGLQSMDDAELDLRFRKCRERSKHKRLPDFAYIHRELQRKGVTRTLLWVEYKEEEPETAYELSQFNELYREWAGKQAISMKQQHRPGERGWTDYSGKKLYWVDAVTGEQHEAEVFVASVGVSGYLFAFATDSQSEGDWIHAHSEWYSALGGVPAITVPDNLKAAVDKPGRDPSLNRAYQDMAEHYGTVILPARPRRPKDKARVENAVLIFLRWGIARLRNRVFHSLAEINAAIAELVAAINHRPMRLYKQSRFERFQAIDRPALKPLPIRYEYGEWIGPVRVPPDYHIAVKGHFYSVPYRLIQQQVYARCTMGVVEIMYDRTRVASHVRSAVVGGKTTDRAHMPEHHLAWADHTPDRYLDWARNAGLHTVAVVEQLLSNVRHPAGALNACGSLQKLQRTHGKERFELACEKALLIHSPTVKSIRSILQNRLEGRPHDETKTRIPKHSNVRGANYYQEGEMTHAD